MLTPCFKCFYTAGKTWLQLINNVNYIWKKTTLWEIKYTQWKTPDVGPSLFLCLKRKKTVSFKFSTSQKTKTLFVNENKLRNIDVLELRLWRTVHEWPYHNSSKATIIPLKLPYRFSLLNSSIICTIILRMDIDENHIQEKVFLNYKLFLWKKI